ncbi:MAG: MFS transporter [Legionella sp.]|nr:MAG: MFS transporter [Legionella sp.]PJD98639.1 MAG: MFS transporter [Legionella sp.]
MIYPWLIWLLGAGFFFYKYLVQVSPSVMTHDLMKAFHVNAMGLGNLSAFYFYAYLVMQIPVGILLDRYSPKVLTVLAIFLCSMSTFIFSQTDSLGLACLARAMIGTGAAFAAISCFKLATLWFPPKRFALISGLCMTAAMLGGVFGQVPLSFLVEWAGWRSALRIISFLGILLGFLYLIVVRDKSTSSSQSSSPEEGSGLHIRSVIGKKQTWLLSLYSGLAFAPVSVFGGLWGVPFLQVAYSISKSSAAFSVSCIFIGFAAGAPLLGWLSDYIGRRKPILFSGTLIAFFCIIVVMFSPTDSLLVLSTMLFFFGFGASGFFTSFAMIRELFPVMLAGTVLGVMNTFDSVCEALFEPMIGAILDWTWDGKIIDGVHVFSITNYHAALLLLPLSLAVAIFLLFFIEETWCTPIDAFAKKGDGTSENSASMAL